MQSTVHLEYLASEVLTATPQKLQWMLIDGAVRQAERAKERMSAGQQELAGEAIIKCQEIVTEVLAGLNYEDRSPLVRQIAGVYNFVFRALIAAHLKMDVRALDDALGILRTERQTWQMVCEQQGTSAAAPLDSSGLSGGLSLDA